MRLSLLDAATRTALLARARNLHPSAPAQWGKLDAPGMLAHLNLSFQSAKGEIRLKRALIGRLLGPFARNRYIRSEAPFSKNSPTAKELIPTGQTSFDAELQRLEALVRAFPEPGGIDPNPHPFFGPLTREEWGWLMAKHLDHHLRQFGV